MEIKGQKASKFCLDFKTIKYSMFIFFLILQSFFLMEIFLSLNKTADCMRLISLAHWADKLSPGFCACPTAKVSCSFFLTHIIIILIIHILNVYFPWLHGLDINCHQSNFDLGLSL